MTTVEDILNNFSDTELAYLNKYQLDSYLGDTQTKIKKFIFEKRGLTQNKLDDLIKKNEDREVANDIEHCPRCKTDKISSYKIQWNIPLFKAGAEDEYAMLHEIQTGQTYTKDKIICNVCGYVLFDPNNEKRPFYKKLADFFFDSPMWSLFRRE